MWCQRSPGRQHHLHFLFPPMLSVHCSPRWSGMICPCWSHTGSLRSPPSLARALTQLPGGSFPWSPPAQLWGSLVRHSMLPCVVLFLKNGSHVSLFPVTEGFTWQPWLFEYGGECLGNHVSQFFQDPGTRIIGTHKLFACLVSSGGFELALSLVWEAFCSPKVHLEVQGQESGGRTVCQWRVKQRPCSVLQPPTTILLPFPFSFIWVVCFPLPFFSSQCTRRIPCYFHILCQVQFLLCIGFPCPGLLHFAAVFTSVFLMKYFRCSSVGCMIFNYHKLKSITSESGVILRGGWILFHFLPSCFQRLCGKCCLECFPCCTLKYSIVWNVIAQTPMLCCFTSFLKQNLIVISCCLKKVTTKNAYVFSVFLDAFWKLWFLKYCSIFLPNIYLILWFKD